jgi:hypothetical protein
MGVFSLNHYESSERKQQYLLFSTQESPAFIQACATRSKTGLCDLLNAGSASLRYMASP